MMMITDFADQSVMVLEPMRVQFYPLMLAGALTLRRRYGETQQAVPSSARAPWLSEQEDHSVGSEWP